MSQSPYEIALQRQNASKQEVEALRVSYERNRVQKCLDFFNQTVTKFVSFVEKHDYPCAKLETFGGERCVGYPLYWTTSTEGEIQYSHSPLTLLINEQRQVLFTLETRTYSAYGAPSGAGHPVQFVMPTGYEEYKQAAELPYRKFTFGEGNPGDDLLLWSAVMEYFMEGYREHGYYEGMDYVNRWVSDNHKKRARFGDVVNHVLTDGHTFEQYLSIHRKIQAG